MNITKLYRIISLTLLIGVFLSSPPIKAFDSNENSEKITVTLTHAPIIGNPEALEFVDRCLKLQPFYYRYTTLGQMLPILKEGIHTPQQQTMRVRLSAMDSHEFMGWYLIRETKTTGESQIAGILGLDSNLDTHRAETSLIYLPRDKLWNQKGLTRKVLEFSQKIIEPHLGQPTEFLKKVDEETFEAIYQKETLAGICASIYFRNYPSLITAYRSGFRAFALTDKSFLGYELVLANPSYKQEDNAPEVETYLNSNPTMRSLALSANRALELLEKRETRAYGKLYLWHIHCSYSGIYTAAKWVLGVSLIAAALYHHT